MGTWFFACDLHGRIRRYQALFEAIRKQRPAAVLLGGDLLPHGLARHPQTAAGDFFEFLADELRKLRSALEAAYPRVLVILGNDDPRSYEPAVQELEAEGLWHYAHQKCVSVCGHQVYGYACVPPTPFRLKDWERYDVSRYVDPGCIPPEEGWTTVEIPEGELRLGTIEEDLRRLFGTESLDRAVCLFHAPPYQTSLDRAALDGVKVDHAPLDVHVGSIAIRRFIEERQPLVTLHGHIHESARLTGRWQEQIGRTWCFSAAHDGPELALVCFDPAEPEQARRVLL